MLRSRIHLASVIIALSVSVVLFSQQTFEEFKQQQQGAFSDFVDPYANYSALVTQQYDAYLQEQQAAYDAWKAEIEAKWDQFRESSTTVYVDYDEDTNARAAIDYEKGEVEVEVIVEADEPEPDKVAEEKLKEKVADVVSKPAPDEKPMLQGQVADKKGKPVEPKEAKTFAKEVVKEQKPEKKTYTAKDGTKRVAYKVKVKMLPDHEKTRAERFRDEVVRQAKRFKVDPATAFAIMHTESYFNPQAKSHIPAYGLMQLVPKSGARDAYLYVYGKDKVVRGNYLYVPRNNIELGCAYIAKLRHVYFKRMEDDLSAYYCVIAAYNTGPGNVSRALTGTTKLRPLTDTVNGHDADWVYRNLKKKLPYEETRKYLDKVTDRIAYYQEWTK